MQSMVVYSTQSGNTMKAAQAVLKGMPPGAELFPVDHAPDPAGFDLVACGFWFKGGGPDAKAAEFLPKLGGRKVILFATHGAAVGSSHASAGLAKAAGLAQGADILGSCSCQGKVNDHVLGQVAARPEPPVWIDDAVYAEGHPDKDDMDRLSAEVADMVAGIDLG